MNANRLEAQPRRLVLRTPPRPVRRESNSVEALRRRFHGLSPFTVGLEEELLGVDAETLAPVPAAATILAAPDADPRSTPELRSSQLDLITPLFSTAREAVASVGDLRRNLRGRLDHGVSFIAAGAHPLASYPGPMAQRPRYRAIVRDYPWVVRMTLTCGLHVHVTVPGAERALAVYNALRGYLPLIGAIGVNSPFHAGEDSGMASVRGALNAALLRTGIPPAFATVASYATYVHWGSGAAAAHRGFRLPDMRLSPRLGTIEVRVADAQTRLEDSAAIAALVQALAAWLARRYDDGEQLPVHPTHYIQENAWLAARDGTGGQLVDLDTGTRRFTADMLAGLIRDLLPIATELGSEAELDGALRLVLETGADRQRSMAEAAGIDGLLYWLATRTARSEEQNVVHAPTRRQAIEPASFAGTPAQSFRVGQP